MYFSEKINSNIYTFSLTIPDYETGVFGGKVSELRLVKNDEIVTSKNNLNLTQINKYLKDNNIISCTFRGKENIEIIQFLNNLDFKFIATYNTISLSKKEFKEINLNSNLIIKKLNKDQFEEILELESKVFDFSTYQIDNRFNSEITSKRNALRVKSYFNKKGNYIFAAEHLNVIIGFLQFNIDYKNGIADCVNGAIHIDYQGHFVGPKLYSDSFKKIFKMKINTILGGYCTQNFSVSKIFKACNFRIINQEIHLRIKID